MTFARNLTLLAMALFVAMFTAPVSAVVTDSNIWINEFHYDDAGGDMNEFIEVVAPSTFADLNTVTVTLYNDADNMPYDTVTLDSFDVGDTTNGFTYYSKTFAPNGIQNGQEGIALSVGATVAQFLSYEGVLTASGGAADGFTSTNIGVSQSGEAGDPSIQLQGTGDSLDDFGNNWVKTSTNTKGGVNESQLVQNKLFNETFDDASQLIVTTGAFFSDGGTDYFGIEDGGSGEDFGGGSSPNVKNYTGNDGNFLTGQDLDDGGTRGNLVTLEWSGIDISGFEDLKFTGDFGEVNNTPTGTNAGHIDAADFILVEVQIDGGGFVDLLEFRGNDSDRFNGLFALDTNGDGFGDGSTTLNGTLAAFLADISGSGTTLDLRLSVSVDSGDEDFAIDSLMIFGNPTQGGGADVPEPTSMALLGLGGLALARRRRTA